MGSDEARIGRLQRSSHQRAFDFPRPGLGHMPPDPEVGNSRVAGRFGDDHKRTSPNRSSLSERQDASDTADAPASGDADYCSDPADQERGSPCSEVEWKAQGLSGTAPWPPQCFQHMGGQLRPLWTAGK
jgi:hypothetical protein